MFLSVRESIPFVPPSNLSHNDGKNQSVITPRFLSMRTDSLRESTKWKLVYKWKGIYEQVCEQGGARARKEYSSDIGFSMVSMITTITAMITLRTLIRTTKND